MVYYHDAERLVSAITPLISETLSENLKKSEKQFSSVEEVIDYLQRTDSATAIYESVMDKNNIHFWDNDIISDYGVCRAINNFTETDSEHVAREIISHELDKDKHQERLAELIFEEMKK